jgi:glycogen synthase
MRATERKLEELVARYRPDILHAHSPVLNGIPALRAARRAKLPLVYEVRAFWEDAAVDLGRTRANSLRYRAIQKLETYVLRHAQGVVTLCEGMRKEIAGRGIPEERIAVVPNAVEPTHFGRVPDRDPALAEQLRLSGSSDLFTIMKALISCSLRFRKSEPLIPTPFSYWLAVGQKNQNCERKSRRKI